MILKSFVPSLSLASLTEIAVDITGYAAFSSLAAVAHRCRVGVGATAALATLSTTSRAALSSLATATLTSLSTVTHRYGGVAHRL